MENKFETAQEHFWAGSFGDDYIGRNSEKHLLASKTNLFSNILNRTNQISSALELGANIGLNLKALRLLCPDVQLAAVEINAKAVEELHKQQDLQVYHESILNFNCDRQYDFVFTCGVLIHINPEVLEDVYRKMYTYSSKYICIAEYYNPTPAVITYRGHSDRLFKRDFAAEILKIFPDLQLISYGFAYHGDKNFPQDDLTWFLMEKKS
jgi:pseudaminic acid biosynthesis-associated methylase